MNAAQDQAESLRKLSTLAQKVEASANTDARRYDSNALIVFAGDFNLDASGGPAASAIDRAQFQDAFTNRHARTTPHSFLEQGRTIDWIFTRGPIRAVEPRVHCSISASDHYSLSVTLAFA